MSSKKSILAFVLALAVMACTACRENEVIGSAEAPQSTSGAEDMESAEVAQTLAAAELNHTYTTQFGQINDVDYPSFTFSYPDGWTISEDITSVSELVELTNDSGVVIRFQYLVPAHAYGNMVIQMETETVKIADSSFIPSFAQQTDYSNIGAFVVAKIKTVSTQNLHTDSEPAQSDSDYYSYAIMPESECGTHSKDGNFVTAFKYDGLLQFMAETPQMLTPEQEQEVVAILASFTAAEQERAPTEESEILTALQNGDFSYFAGIYERCAVYDEYYGGGEKLPNLLLQEDGIITGGLVYGSYPDTKPISVKMNEDGSYLCQVRYTSSSDQDYFVIYPQGIIGENPYIYNDPFLTETPYIHYFQLGGGAMDIIYYLIEE